MQKSLTNKYCASTQRGVFTAYFEKGLLVRLEFPRGAAKKYPALESQEGEAGKRVKNFLRGYFGGGAAGPDFRVELDGLTVFQKKVLQKIKEIPRGRVITYGELAKKIGCPRAARAAGSACGKNPLPVIIPCHRVVAKNGLGGFSAPLKWKKIMLRLEGHSVKR